MARLRQLVVVADDFGIGPETDRGILELGAAGLVASTVLLVNSPYAEAGVAAWNRAGRPVELGWHPALTLDQPILPSERVPSLVDAKGKFHPLGRFLRNSMLGRVRPTEVLEELAAQYERFVELVGHPPRLVNSHQHASLFRPVTAALHELLTSYPERPFVRRVREPWRTLARIPGARIKRIVLNSRGRKQARTLERDGFPGCDWLAGITDPPCVSDPHFYERWLSGMPGQSVELMCHPGHMDRTLVGRDCEMPGSGRRPPSEKVNGSLATSATNVNSTELALLRRVREFEMFHRAEFREVTRSAGFELVPASRLGQTPARAAA